MAERKSVYGKATERHVRLLQRRYPDLDILGDMAEQCLKARDDVRLRDEWTENPEKADGDFARVSIADRRMVVGLYSDLAKHLIPTLKAVDVKAGGADGGPITVVFEAPSE
jgi:hypothetical protein